MTSGTIDDSQRKAARVWGFTYLFALANVMFVNFGIHDRFIVAGKAAETARNIMAHEQLFRVGIACDLLYCICLVIALTALYVILSPVNRNLALFGAFCILVYASMWVLMTLNVLDALRLLSGADYLRAFEIGRLQALARRSLGASFDEYYVGLLFYGLGTTVLNCLWFKSGYIPKVLAGWGVAACAWCAACSFVFFIFPGFPKFVNLWWFDTPMGLFEITTSFWLLFRGLRPSGGGAGAARQPTVNFSS